MASASDDFNRANENPLAGNWETVIAGLQLASNVGKAASAAACAAAYKASVTAFSGDHYSEFVIGNATAFDYPGAGLRCNTTGGGNGYFAVVETDSNRIQWRKLVLGVFSNIGSTIAYTDANGDTIRASVTTNGVSADLRVYVNGVQQGATLNDAVGVLTGGQPGLYYEFGNSNGTTIDNFAAADLGSGGNVNLLTGKLGGPFAGKV